jgi:hypothetical protein
MIFHYLTLDTEIYDLLDLPPSWNIAGSDFRPLPSIPHCRLETKLGPCLSSNVADQSLKPTKGLWLGKPLPYQQPDPIRAFQTTIFL